MRLEISNINIGQYGFVDITDGEKEQKGTHGLAGASSGHWQSTGLHQQTPRKETNRLAWESGRSGLR